MIRQRLPRQLCGAAFDIEQKEIEEAIERVSEETQKKINLTSVWRKKYPVLTTYQETVKIDEYASEIRKLLDSLKKGYGYSDLDAMLVLKDILAHVWNTR